VASSVAMRALARILTSAGNLAAPAFRHVSTVCFRLSVMV
jgi:hypothetical protein